MKTVNKITKSLKMKNISFLASTVTQVVNHVMAVLVKHVYGVMRVSFCIILNVLINVHKDTLKVIGYV